MMLARMGCSWMLVHLVQFILVGTTTVNLNDDYFNAAPNFGDFFTESLLMTNKLFHTLIVFFLGLLEVPVPYEVVPHYPAGASHPGNWPL